MKIVEIREKTIPISSPIRNAYIDFSKMTLSLVAVITDVIRDGKPVVGYGFNSNGRYGQGKLMRERFIPRVMEADPESLLDASGKNLDPHKIWNTMFTNEKPGGHGERSVAIGTIDMAVWDAVAKIEGKPLFQLLADRYGDGKPNRKIFVYAAGGYYYPGQDHQKLKDEMRSYIDRGYRVVKKKIGGASLDEDLRRIDSILSVLQDGQKLCVDANGRFDLDTAIAYAKALSQYDLFWYEEPGDPLDFELQATLRNYYKNPMATGEDLFSMQDARNLIRYGGMRPDRDWLQFDCALSYGLVEYLRTLDMLKEHGWSPSRCIPHGGHQMSLNIAAGLGLGGNESYPDLFQPFGGFPDGVKVENSYVTLPDLPGIGFEGKSDLIKEMRALASMTGAIQTASKYVELYAVARAWSAIGSLRIRLPRGRKDRIGQRRHDARRSRLADAAGRLQALHEVHVDSRHFVDAQHAVVAEVGLLDAAVLDRDLAVKRGRQTEDDAALHLRANRVGIDLHAAIDDAPHMRRLDHAFLVDADLNDLRDEAAEADAERDATALSRRQRLAPSGLVPRRTAARPSHAGSCRAAPGGRQADPASRWRRARR